VRFTVEELGFKGPATWGEILAAPKPMGLKLCPDLAAIPLRLAYADQPEGEVLNMAMTPVEKGYSKPRVYRVMALNGQRIMDAVPYVASQIFGPKSEFVFARR
jgi:hypothetical protein